MKKKTECDNGKKYGCPYMGKCSGEFRNISIDNLSSLTNSEYLWYFTKTNLTRTSKIWFNQDSKGEDTLYVCQPRAGTKPRTFYESEKNKLIFKIKKSLLAQVSKLSSSLRNEIKNIEEKVD